MKKFAALISILATSTKTNAKLKALQDYFADADEKDKVWVIALFTGRRPKRTVSGALLAEWCMAITGIPSWLFGECYHTTGDFAETISLLLPENTLNNAEQSLSYYVEGLISLSGSDDEQKRNFIVSCWQTLSQLEIFILNKLITGGFRIGVSQKMMVNALARSSETPESIIAHRLTGKWDPTIISFNDLVNATGDVQDISKPYPFYLAYAIDEDVSALGDPGEWQAEWKWDGIRGQIIRRENELFVWSRGEELITDKFPEYEALKHLLPEGVAIDGEIISLATIPVNAPFKPLPFAALQTRIGRKNVTRKQLTEAPVGFIAYDVLEVEGRDLRDLPLIERRAMLQEIVNNINLSIVHISPVIQFKTWEELKDIRAQSRDIGSEGIMLKRKNSVYLSGRKRGDWWKWKIDPLTIDAVMVYAQKGSGRRSNLYTDYTFAVRNGAELITFAKAYSGLTDKEFAQVDAFVKRNSIEKFGPVRTVKPELVFEIAFEGIAASGRHKSGVALRFPRISRWRKDKKADEINTLDDLKQMLLIYGNVK